MTWPNNEFFRGQFSVNADDHLVAKWTNGDGDTTDSEVKDGKAHGKGQRTDADGESFVGEFRNGAMYAGVQTFTDGGKWTYYRDASGKKEFRDYAAGDEDKPYFGGEPYPAAEF